jgi:type I restriction enzyme S subunit
VADWELPETWRIYSTAELLRCGAFVDVKDGNHGANHPKVSEFTESGLPFITATQVNNYRIDYDSAYKLSGKPLSRVRVGFAKSGDVIYTHKGSVGRVAVADRHCVLTPQTTYYRVNPDVFLNQFVMFYLASNAISEQVNVVKEQTTRDFVPISEQYLLFHRVPPLVEQQEIVRRVEALFKTADALEARYRKAKAHVDKLTQSILAKAFRGELVPQDPNDESASTLLERIRQTKDAAGVKKRGASR